MRKTLISLAALLAGTALSAQNVAVPGAAQAAASAPELPNGPGTGPFAAIMEIDPSLPDHVIYRPANLGALGKTRLGVLAWGNGGCRADGASARQHLLEVASHGYLVVAPGGIHSGPTASGNLPVRAMGADGKLPPVATTFEDVREGIDWALAQNTRKGSPFRKRIDPAAVAVAGHSCGGLQALQVAGDPRVRTVLVHNSGVFTDGANPIQGVTVDKSLLKTIHTPIVYFLGGPDDVAWPNGTDDYKRIDQVPAAMVAMPVGHGGTFRTRNGGAVAQAAVDWLDWQLRGDKVAGRSFTGADCRLCVVPGWTVERKKID